MHKIAIIAENNDILTLNTNMLNQCNSLTLFIAFFLHSLTFTVLTPNIYYRKSNAHANSESYSRQPT